MCLVAVVCYRECVNSWLAKEKQMKRVAFLSFDWDFEVITAYYEGMCGYLEARDDALVVEGTDAEEADVDAGCGHGGWPRSSVRARCGRRRRRLMRR